MSEIAEKPAAQADKPTAQLAIVGQAMTEFEKVAAGIAALETRYKDVVYPVTTTRGLDEAKAARADIRDARYAVQRAAKSAKSELAAISKNIGEKADQIIAPLEALEAPIDQQIKAEEARKEAEKEAKRLAEVARVEAIAAKIAAIRASGVAPVGAGSAEIFVIRADLSDAVYTAEEFQEFLPAAERARDDALSQLRVAHEAAAAAEAEAARLAAERAELERQRKEQEAALAAERARLAEERRQQEAERKRVEQETAARQAAEKAERDRQAAVAAEEARKAAEAVAAERAELERQREELRLQLEAARAAAQPAVVPVALTTKEAAEVNQLLADLDGGEAADDFIPADPAPLSDAIQDALNTRPEDYELRDVISAHFDVLPEVADEWLRTYGSQA